MPHIFISYRREDSPANARLICERLEKWFGDGNIFMDVENIELGDNWKDVLNERVARCDAMLAVIGTIGSPLPAAKASADSMIRRTSFVGKFAKHSSSTSK